MMRTPKWWTRKNWQSTALLPASWLYGLGQRLDKRCTRVRRAPLPVIGIGNLTAGGAGKTPTAIALAQLLQQLGETPHIVSRGYGGHRQHARAVDPTRDTASEVGDEALLLARHAPTWVGADRLASATAAHRAGATLVIADDALQHYALHQDQVIVVIDSAYGFGNGRLLPAGPLREPWRPALLPRHHYLLLLGTDDPQGLMRVLPAPNGWMRASIEPSCEVEFLRRHHWLAFAGIARPEKFYATLRQHGAMLGDFADFADHHPFSDADLQALDRRAEQQGLRLITTEKDAMRLPAAWRHRVATLPVALHWADPDAARHFMQRIMQEAIKLHRGLDFPAARDTLQP